MGIKRSTKHLISTVLSAFVLIALFQNCTKIETVYVKVTDQDNSNESGSGGNNYDGKIYENRILTGGLCPDGSDVRARIVLMMDLIPVIVRDECKDIEPRRLGALETTWGDNLEWAIFDKRAFTQKNDPNLTPVPTNSGDVLYGSFFIRPRHTKHCIQDMSAVGSSSPIEQRYCDPADNRQRWVIDFHAPTDRYVIRNVATNQCLDVKDGSTAEFGLWQTVACQGTYEPAVGILFSATPLASGHYQIKSKLSSKCMEVKDASIENGALVQQFSCGPDLPHQNFELLEIK